MSVVDNENGAKLKQAIRDGQQEKAQQRRGAGTDEPHTRSRVSRGMKRNQVGEAVSEFTAVVEKTLAKADQNFQFKVIAMDGARWSLHYSIAVITASLNIEGKDVVSAFAMILEGSNSRPTAAPQVLGRNASVEVILTAMDAWEDITFNKIIEAVQEATGIESVLSAGACVIPAAVDFKDEHRMHQIVWNANEALHSSFETSYPDSFDHINIKDFIGDQDRLVLAAEFNHGDVESVVGEPVRSDIKFRMAVTESGSDTNVFTDWQHKGTRDLLEVSAFVNPVFVGPGPAPAYGQVTSNHMLLPQVIVTQVAAVEMPFTPESYFLGLSTIAMLGDEYQWAQQFTNFGENSMHDIAMVGLRVTQLQNPREKPVPLDTISNGFGEDELGKVVREFFYAEPVFCIDAEDAGVNSWLTSIMVDAARNDADGNAAHDWLCNAINRLTGNSFARHHDGGALFSNEGVRVHLGTYKDTDGTIRDLRALDSTAWGNLIGHNDMEGVEIWEDTFNNDSIPQETRLETRLNMMREQLGATNVTVTGFADRIIATRSLMDGLVAAVVEAGLSVDQQGLRPFYGDNHTTGNTSLQRHAFASSGNAMVRQRPGGRNAQQRRQFSPFNRN